MVDKEKETTEAEQEENDGTPSILIDQIKGEITKDVIATLSPVLASIKSTLKSMTDEIKSVQGNIAKEVRSQVEANGKVFVQQFIEELDRRNGGNGETQSQTSEDRGNGNGSRSSFLSDLVELAPTLEKIFGGGGSGDDAFISKVESLVRTRDALNQLCDSGGPGPDRIFKAQQDAFMEGVKVGTKGIKARPLASSPSGGRSPGPGRRSTRDTIIARM